MNYNFTIKESNHSKAALTAINFLLNLTDRELDIIASIVDNDINEINKSTKDIIKDSIKIDSYGLNNYLVSLRKKGFIVKNKLAGELIEACKDKSIVINFNYEEDAN